MEEAMEMAQSKNIEERIAGVERVQQILEVSRKSLSSSEVSNLVDICLDLMNNTEFRVSEGALQVLTSAAALSGLHFKIHFNAIVPPVVERLGDANQPVRDAARLLLLTLMEKQTKLVLDENQFLENILRTLLQELVTSAVQSGEEVMHFGKSIDDNENGQAQIPHLLDIVLYLCEKEHVEGGMIFQLLEDLTEMSTMRNCKDIFGYIESKQDILGKQELFARGKLVMLRTCNQLLRRLSKANDVVFCGRILMFLAHFFPLSERSAVNIKGVFNTSNATTYEKISPEGFSIDFNFYKTFWSLQEYFCNPASVILTPTKWQKFMSCLLAVLNTFEAQPLNDEEGNAHNLEDEAQNFNIKYLTSSKLMGLELKDPSFRRQILVQCLILFDYLKTPGKTDKDIPSEKLEGIKSCEEHVKKLMEITPPKGKQFLRSVEHILEREKNWVWWKRDGCQPFEKQPSENKTIHAVRKRRPRWRLGNKELSQLWKWADQNQNALTDAERVRTPSVLEYWKPLAEDMDESAGIDAEYHHKNNKVYCWKGLRFSARQDLEGFSRFSEYGVEGVIPLQLLPPHIRSKYQNKLSDRSKRLKPDSTKRHIPPPNPEEKVQGVAPVAVEEEGGEVRRDVCEPIPAELGTHASSTPEIPKDETNPTPRDVERPSSDAAADVAMVEAGEVEEDIEEEVELRAIK